MVDLMELLLFMDQVVEVEQVLLVETEQIVSVE